MVEDVTCEDFDAILVLAGEAIQDVTTVLTIILKESKLQSLPQKLIWQPNRTLNLHNLLLTQFLLLLKLFLSFLDLAFFLFLKVFSHFFTFFAFLIFNCFNNVLYPNDWDVVIVRKPRFMNKIGIRKDYCLP